MGNPQIRDHEQIRDHDQSPKFWIMTGLLASHRRAAARGFSPAKFPEYTS
jgi:hypothetical protein